MNVRLDSCGKRAAFSFVAFFSIIYTSRLWVWSIREKINQVLLDDNSKQYPYIGLLIDDRKTPTLIDTVHNVLQHIPSDWKIQIFTLQEHWSYYINSTLGPFIQKKRVFMTPIGFERGNMRGADYINTILTSTELWERVRGDKVLYFQFDAALCSNSASNITEFLKYDFVGAPWAVGGCCNGGISIRSRTKILELLRSGKVKYRLRSINEDGWFTNNLRRVNGTIVPIQIAKRFSVETIYHPRPFAVHKPRVGRLGEKNMKRLCQECPEVALVSKDCSAFSNL